MIALNDNQLCNKMIANKYTNDSVPAYSGLFRRLRHIFPATGAGNLISDNSRCRLEKN